MDSSLTSAVNCALSWLIVALSALGYVLTQKRMGQKWALWFVLGSGWGLIAISNTLLLVGVRLGTTQLQSMWLGSYLLVMASLLLLFLKFIALKGQPR